MKLLISRTSALWKSNNDDDDEYDFNEDDWMWWKSKHTDWRLPISLKNGTISTDFTDLISQAPLLPWQLFPALRDQNFSIPVQVCPLMFQLCLRHHRYHPHPLAAPGLMEVPLLAEEACWLRITKTSERNLNRKDRCFLPQSRNSNIWCKLPTRGDDFSISLNFMLKGLPLSRRYRRFV